MTTFALLLVAGIVGGAPALESLFPHEARVTVDEAGLARLELPPEVLAECRADLSDLRLFDVRGTELPFAVDGGAPGPLEEVTRIPVRIMETKRHADRPADAPARSMETYVLDASLAAGPAGDAANAWELVLEPRAQRFVRKVTVRDRGRIVSEGSIFRLAGGLGTNCSRGSPSRCKTRVPLNVPRTETLPATLEVTLEGEGEYLEPEMSLEGSRVLGGRGQAAVVALEELSRRSENGITTLEVRRPAGLVPDVIEIVTAEPLFDRAIEVWDAGLAAATGEAPLGAGSIFRVDGVEERAIFVGRARGDRLRIRIHDGSSPVLAALEVRATVRTPALIYSAPAPGRSAILRYGGGRAMRPAYDVAALLPFPGARDENGRERSRVTRALLEGAAAHVARLETSERNPSFDSRPSLEFAMAAGAQIESRRFRNTVPLEVTASPDGLSSITLSPAILALARADLADLRVIDSASRQRPYLIERGSAAAVWMPVSLSGSVRGADLRSKHTLALPNVPVTLDQVEVDAAVPFFDRRYWLTGVRAGEQEPVILTHGRLSRRAQDPRPVLISFPATRLESVTLEIDDGDDAPLAVTVRVRAPVPELLLVAPPGSYTLLAGSADEPPPRYELGNVREILLAVVPGRIDAGTPAPNPRYSAALGMLAGTGPARIGLWLALVVAVVVLGGLTWRLARSPEPEPPVSDQKA